MIVSIPQEFLKVASYFRDCFTKPQFQNFCRYVWGLVVCEGGRNIMDIAGAYLEATDQATLNHFICDATWSHQMVRDKRILMVNRALTRHVRKSTPMFLVVDDIVITKTGKCMQGAGYFYSNKEGKTVWAHNFVSSFLVAAELRMPLEIFQYRKKNDCREGGIPFKKKTDTAVNFILDYPAPPGREITVLFDSFYLCKKVVRAVREKKWQWVSRLTMDRGVYYNDEQMTVEALEEKAVALSDYRGVNVEKSYLCYATRPVQVYIPDVGPAQVVFSKARVSSEQKKMPLEKIEPKATATSAMGWTKKKILTFYGKRSLIENGYRDEKQNLGLGQYQVRKSNGIVRHAELVFCAHPLLVLMNLQRTRGQRFQTLGQMCEWAKQLQLRETVTWVYQRFNAGENLDDVLDTLSL